MATKLLTAPAVTPVTLAETKAHLRVDFDDDDSLIELFMKAATDSAQQFMGRAIVEQTWQMVIDEFPSEGIRLDYPPLISVNSIIYNDTDGNPTILSPGDYYVDDVSQHGWVVPVSSWPSTLDAINAVEIEYVAGYSAAGSPPDYVANIPFAIKAAVLMTIGTFYAHRETVVIGKSAMLLPWAAEQLLRQYRIDIAMA